MTSESACVSLPTAIGFCLATSIAFVGSLYLLVPSSVRTLDRDHPSQIKWRSCATGLICFGAYGASRHLQLSCAESDGTVLVRTASVPHWALHALTVSTKALAHATVLYAGPIAQGAAVVAAHVRRRSNPTFTVYIKSLYGYHLEPTFRSLSFQDGDNQGWLIWRNLVIAPALEEVAFRTCMVPVLLASGLRAGAVCWVAPLFFGIAHVHHAVQRLREGRTAPTTVVVQTAFQFTYTTLFGAYAAYVYMRTRSTVAVTILHGFCNWMGLPHFLFLSQKHVLHEHRRVLLVAHAIGVIGFGALLFRGYPVGVLESRWAFLRAGERVTLFSTARDILIMMIKYI